MIVKQNITVNSLAFYIITFNTSLKINQRVHVYNIQLMYSVTGQTEDQQVSHQHCPLRVLIFEIGQPIINVKRFSRFSPNNYVMKHNGAILLNFIYI